MILNNTIGFVYYGVDQGDQYMLPIYSIFGMDLCYLPTLGILLVLIGILAPIVNKCYAYIQLRNNFAPILMEQRTSMDS